MIIKKPYPLIILGQGDPTSPNTWSGIPYSLIQAFRAQGVNVHPVDVESHGASETLSKLLTIVPDRARWAARHHYGPLAYRFRSRRAARATSVDRNAAVLQFGAQFCAFPERSNRYHLYCDSNVFFGAQSPYPKRSSSLTSRELTAMIERERRVYSRAEKIFTFSENLRTSFISDFGLEADRVVTVFAGANFSATLPEFKVSAPKDSPPTILFVGREFERKGGQDLIAAFIEVRKIVPDARLVIAGANLKLDAIPGLEVVGFIDRSDAGRARLSSLYLAADIFCMPSRYEAFGIVFVEAMLHGLPCIGTTEGAMPEIIEHGRTGWIVPPRNPRELAITLIKALSDRQSLSAMGLAGRSKALEHFTWDQVVHRMCLQMGSA